MGQEVESEDSQVDMDKIYRQLDAEDKVIEYLAGEIAKERKKPGFLQDQARINKCLDMIAKLKNHKTKYSQEELKAKADALLAKARAKEAAETAATPAPIRRYRLRPVLVAVILLVVVCLCGATACGVIPSLRMWFAKIVNNPGASVDDNGITYSYNGQAVIYKDIHELLEKEQLDILYPSKLPDGVELKNVQRSIDNNTESIFFTYNDTKVSIYIKLNFHDEFNASELYQKHVVGDITAYYWQDEALTRYVAVFLVDNTYYFISAKDESSLLYILDNLKES
jgi:hypothetical protein